MTQPKTPLSQTATGTTTARRLGTLLALVSLGHLLCDGLQSIIPAVLPILKENLSLTFAQVGMITLILQLMGSLLQPIIGWTTDRHPTPLSLPAGMSVTLVGLILLGWADNFPMVLLAVACMGVGAAVLHPEASRMAQVLSNGRKGFAQSVFQLGGNIGMSLGPLAAAFVVIPYGQASVAWFAIPAGITVALLYYVSEHTHRIAEAACAEKTLPSAPAPLTRAVWVLFGLLFLLMFSKQVYIACLQNFLTFYLMEKFSVELTTTQYVLFAFLAASAAGTMAGGPLTDHYGRRIVILGSILGASPFALLLPWAPLEGAIALMVIVSFIMSSAFSAILVCAFDAAPGRLGMISGIFFGLSFGLGGVATVLFGDLADRIGMEAVFVWISLLPLIGIAGLWLPKEKKPEAA